LISIRKAGAAALASTLMLVLPGTALANGGDHDGQRFDRGGRGFGGVPSRIANKLRSAERAMDRAQDHADDAEPDAAVAALAAVQRHLTSAQKSVARRVRPATRAALRPPRRSRARRATSWTARSGCSTARRIPSSPPTPRR
jgi:hypothetical protein